jgi:sugar O-acyltransferase (sialic acid O-acetyltransferase NeuD family)
MQGFVFGAGAQGRAVADILRDAKTCESIHFVDDNPALRGAQINGIEIAGSLEEVARAWTDSCRLVVALGKPGARLSVADRATALGMQFMNAVHPSAVIAPTAEMGGGNMIGPGAVLDTNARICEHVIVNVGVLFGHDSVAEDAATICGGVVIGGRVTLGRGSFIGIGALLKPRVRIGEGAVVAAGALVLKDVAPRMFVMGAPARALKEITEEFDWSMLL